MGQPLEIIIWDLDAARINAIDRNLHGACRALGMRAAVTSMSEAPLVARMGLSGRVPLLEIRGQYWSLPEGVPISEQACMGLLRRFRDASRPADDNAF